jgi:hypothetical protein
MCSIPPVDKRNASVIASLARAGQRSTDASPIKQVFIIFSSVRTVDSILHPGKKDRLLEMYFLERPEEDDLLHLLKVVFSRRMWNAP